MNIELESSDIEIHEDLRRFVRRSIDFALSTRAQHIESVLVHLSGSVAAGDFGDKSCRVQVRLNEIADVFVEARDSDLHVAIHRAVDRAGWTVARRLLRRHHNAVASMLTELRRADQPPSGRAA